MFDRFRKLFKREPLSDDELAEQARLNRAAQQARYRAQSEMAQQHARIQSYFDRHPPDGGFGPGPF